MLPLAQRFVTARCLIAANTPHDPHYRSLRAPPEVHGDRRNAAGEPPLKTGLAAIAQKLPDLPPGSTVLGFNYHTGERYLSIEGFLPA